jgi:plasmid stabilization system protein ParE
MEAWENLSTIEEFIARDSPSRAEQFVHYLIERTELLSKNPKMGRVVPEISNPNVREIIVKNYRIVYRLVAKRIEILSVFEGHKLLDIGALEFPL